MGILDFLSKKSPAAPAPAGATETTAAPANALKAEIVNHGLDASRINIAVDGSTVTLTGGAATTADVEKIALAVGNTKGVTKVVNNIVADAPHQDSGFYTVKSGDTLWKIAEESYGHGQGAKYQQIFEANRPLLKNANSIFPGQVLRIPGATGAAAPQASAAAGDDKKGDDIVLEGAHDLIASFVANKCARKNFRASFYALVASKDGVFLAKASSQATSRGWPARHPPSKRKSR